MENNSIIQDEQVIEIDFAKSFQDAIVGSSVLTFESKELKEKVINSRGEQLLVVKSTINSPKNIISVEEYNKSFLLKNL